jgi:hypothetical protein
MEEDWEEQLDSNGYGDFEQEMMQEPAPSPQKRFALCSLLSDLCSLLWSLLSLLSNTLSARFVRVAYTGRVEEEAPVFTAKSRASSASTARLSKPRGTKPVQEAKAKTSRPATATARLSELAKPREAKAVQESRGVKVENKVAKTVQGSRKAQTVQESMGVKTESRSAKKESRVVKREPRKPEAGEHEPPPLCFLLLAFWSFRLSLRSSRRRKLAPHHDLIDPLSLLCR